MGEHRVRRDARHQYSRRRPEPAIALLLVVITASLYGQVVQFDFLRMDDTQYVTQNRQVRGGLTAEGVAYAMTGTPGSTWVPLTLLSHMLDCELYGLNPVGHHVTNVLLHVLNTLLLFGVLRYMTAAVWQSAFVAALFALHPLHVESVAWVSERKDVLSTLLGLLSLWAYAAYAKRGGSGRYALTTILLALGLLAKPMLVTLPLVYLLLDYWPLERIGRPEDDANHHTTTTQKARKSGSPRPSIATLLLEKTPLLAVAAVVSLVTFLTQSATRAVRQGIPIELRAANAVVSYVWYLGKMVWPAHLAVLYPHPYIPGGRPWESWEVIGAGLILLVISALVLWSGRRYALVGWLWYLGTLVPVIGIVQVGYHAIADRYTYIPLIGLFIVIAWGSADLMSMRRARVPLLRPAIGVAAIVALAAATVCTWFQLRHWRSSTSLMQRIVDVTPDSPVGYYYLGTIHLEEGDPEAAVRLYRRALEIGSDYPRAHFNLANVIRGEGEIDQAIHHYRQALRADPDFASAHVNLGALLKSRGDLDEAIHHFREAIRVWPGIAIPHKNLADALREQGKFDEAIQHYEEAIRLTPSYARAHYNLGMTLRSQGRLEEARQHLQQARQLSSR